MPRDSMIPGARKIAAGAFELGGPVRIQRRRTKGWKLPEGVIYVGRPGAFGNPFPVDIYGAERAVDLFRRWLTGNMSMEELSRLSCYPTGSMVSERRALRDALPRLRGKTLACWCKLDMPCHADVLLEIANAPAAAETASLQ